MNEIVTIWIKANVIFALLVLFFALVLRRETLHYFKRLFLLSIPVISLLLPFINFNIQNDKVYEMTQTLNLMPVSETSSLVVETQQGINWQPIFVIGFLCVSLFFISIIIRGLYKVFAIIKTANKEPLNIGVLCNTKENVSPFSFFNYIVLHKIAHTNNELQNIIKHEQVHVYQKHFLDMLFVQISIILSWVNPAVWLYKHFVTENLEFIVDQEVLQTGVNKKQYQFSILNTSVYDSSLVFANHFNQSLIKNRIKMMNKQLSNPKNMWKSALLLPFLFLILIGIGQAKRAENKISLASEDNLHLILLDDQKISEEAYQAILQEMPMYKKVTFTNYTLPEGKYISMNYSTKEAYDNRRKPVDMMNLYGYKFPVRHFDEIYSTKTDFVLKREHFEIAFQKNGNQYNLKYKNPKGEAKASKTSLTDDVRLYFFINNKEVSIDEFDHINYDNVVTMGCGDYKDKNALKVMVTTKEGKQIPPTGKPFYYINGKKVTQGEFKRAKKDGLGKFYEIGSTTTGNTLFLVLTKPLNQFSKAELLDPAKVLGMKELILPPPPPPAPPKPIAAPKQDEYVTITHIKTVNGKEVRTKEILALKVAKARYGNDVVRGGVVLYKANGVEEFIQQPPAPPKPIAAPKSSNDVYDFVTTMPEYPGGVNALRKEVQNAYKIPTYLKDLGIKGGAIVVRFVVQEDGSIGTVKIVKGIKGCTDCSTNAVNVIKNLQHKFSPGMQDGQAKKVWYTLPIIIKVNQSTKNTES